MEDEIKKGYLNYEKHGSIARRLGIKNFDVLNYIRQNEKDWVYERPNVNTENRCSFCDIVVSNEKQEAGRLYNTKVLQHYIIEEHFQICYDCLIKYYRRTYLDNLDYISDILERKDQSDLLNFNKYEN